MISKGTFGSSKAEIYLNDVLIKGQDKQITHKVCRVYNQYRDSIKNLAGIKDKRVYRQVLHLLKDDYSKNIAESGLPDLVKQLLGNCITKEFRNALRARK